MSRLVRQLGITGVDGDAIEMATYLAKHPDASVERLLVYLPQSRLDRVFEYLNLVQPVAYEDAIDLLIATSHSDRDGKNWTASNLASVPASNSTSGVPIDPTSAIPIGALVRWSEQYGVVEALQGNRVTVRFDSNEVMDFSRDANVVTRVPLTAGSQVTRRTDGTVGVVTKQVPGGLYPTWTVAFPGVVTNVAEQGLRLATITDPMDRMRSRELGRANEFNLRSVAADYWTSHLHNNLVSLSHARVDLKPHQVAVVHRVITKYPHRFLLCDEVGLGKTIEAAMIIKELRARGQGKRVLILTPPGLTRQWQYELKTKFNESFAIYNSSTIQYLKDKGTANPWTDHDSIIASHTWASWSSDRIREITEVDWDMVIVDEAHHARLHRSGSSESRTQLFRLVEDLVARPEFSRRGCLFITATPLQLERYELYSLVEMLDPVIFSSEEDFVRHVESLAGLNRVVERLQVTQSLDDSRLSNMIEEIAHFLGVDTLSAASTLRRLGPTETARVFKDRHRLSEVMIRNRKAVVQGFQPRRAFRWEIVLSRKEKRVHSLMDEVFRKGFQLAEETGQNAVGFLMVVLQKLLASSSRALLTSLKRRRARLLTRTLKVTAVLDAEENFESDMLAAVAIEHLAPQIEREIHEFDEVIRLLETISIDTKATTLVEQLHALFIHELDAKVLLFTEFRETQDMLVEVLSKSWSVHVFHGSLDPAQKDASVEAFRNGTGPQILISTEAGGEGRNFQFCHHLVNYDLPWNPMKVEQRIGRVDRIGQEHAITIFNFHVQGTIEGRVLDVLERRIRIFEEAVGGLDPILGEAEADIRNALRLTAAERDAAMERLGRDLERRVARARDAERKLQDFVLQERSFSAEIVQTAMQVEAPVSTGDFERFLIELLASVKSYVGPPSRSGERRVTFHGPFAIEHPELIQGQESRRVCLDPRQNVDSELVEYLGFGHPIIDSLVARVTRERHEGAAAVRLVKDHVAGPGWQFNWLLTVGGIRRKEFVFPVFVDDNGIVDEQIGADLLRVSRSFGSEASAGMPSLAGLDAAFEIAQLAAISRRDQEVATAQRLAEERSDVEEQRLRSLFERRTQAARDRIDSCAATLQRLQGSPDSRVRQAIPLWEANLARAQAELRSIQDDLVASLLDLNRRRSPSAEFALLNVARIEVAAIAEHQERSGY